MVRDDSGKWHGSKRTEWIGLLSFGFFIVALGAVWIATPDFSQKVIDFTKSFNNSRVAENVYLPQPLGDHSTLYTAIMYLTLALAIFQIVVLALRFSFHDSLDRKAGTVSSMAFWFAATYFLYLLRNGTIKWFPFLAGLIICVGLSITVSSIVKLFKR